MTGLQIFLPWHLHPLIHLCPPLFSSHADFPSWELSRTIRTTNCRLSDTHWGRYASCSRAWVHSFWWASLIKTLFSLEKCIKVGVAAFSHGHCADPSQTSRSWRQSSFSLLFSSLWVQVKKISLFIGRVIWGAGPDTRSILQMPGCD